MPVIATLVARALFITVKKQGRDQNILMTTWRECFSEINDRLFVIDHDRAIAPWHRARFLYGCTIPRAF